MNRVSDDLLELAGTAVDAAGEVIRSYFRQPIAVEDKDDDSPVTRADREAESAIRDVLSKARPDDAIAGEEFESVSGRSGLQWVIDPIDGTRAFITGKPTFGTLLALVVDGRPVLGVIDQPIVGDRWIGATGHGTRHNLRPVTVRGCTGLTHAALSTTSPDLFSSMGRDRFYAVERQSRVTVYGSDCYAYGLLASGFLDIVIEDGLKLHDFAALVPVVTGAGGCFSDWQGEPITVTSTGSVIASGDERVHREALSLLNPTA